MRIKPVVVGADGTDVGKTAVRWAAREAQRRGLPLTVVHVYDWQWREAGPGPDYGDPDFTRKHAEGVTATSVFEARVAAPGLKIDGDPVSGTAAKRLIEDAGEADLMVVGSRGRGGFAGLLLGSVSLRVATHAPCSVVVVRGRGDQAEGSVVAGLDDSPAAEGVLEAAFDAAAGRNCVLEVVRSFQPPAPIWPTKAPSIAMTTAQADAEERTRVETQVAPWRDKYPGVRVEVVITHEGIASALVGASRFAQLVLVGSRGHGLIAGTLLGSVGLQLLHHADCPVYIVR
jgi:nucleotide-binding universal stress UspA family protein